jgi:dTDP-4-amino-4,6-dideoxy-D-galactose acyltransferase
MHDVIHHLPWDSSFFALKTGRCILSSPESLTALFEEAEQQDYSLLYLEVQHQLKNQVVGAYSLLDVGGQIRYGKDLSFLRQQAEPDPLVCLCSPEDICQDLSELAYLSGQLSRFKIDPDMPAGSFERLYQVWLLKSLERRTSEAVYTFRIDGKPVGLITSVWESGLCRIGLLAVSPLFQGQGIASALIRHVEFLCTQASINFLEVKTQLVNHQARALYRKRSFRELASSHLYHAHRLR